MNGKLQALFQFLDSFKSRAPLVELEALLRRLDIHLEDVKEFVRFSDRNYQRNLVRAGDMYHAWVMCWKSGQRSPIHDHAASSCAVRILLGTATVTTFAFAPNGMVKAIGSSELEPGCICVTQDKDLHQVSNLQAGNADLVTLHIYSPPLLRMGTYSLTESRRGEDVWEFAAGDGI